MEDTDNVVPQEVTPEVAPQEEVVTEGETMADREEETPSEEAPQE